MQATPSHHPGPPSGPGILSIGRNALTQLRVMSRAKRNRTDLLRYMARRPALLGAMVGYETALLVSSRAPDRLKILADVKATALIGCPF
ncbi:MAG: hypothetical protein ACRDYB_04495 [Acidimicrobiales bacterium]